MKELHTKIQSIFFIILFSSSCAAMEVGKPPFTTTPAEIDIEILCQLVPCGMSAEGSIKSIRALKNVMLTCKKLHRASQNKKVTDYFMGHIAYDPTCPVYTAKTINARLDPLDHPAEKQLKNAKTIALDSLKYHHAAAEKCFIDSESHGANQFDDEAYDRYIADQKRMSQAYNNALYPSYQRMYAAANINTPQARAIFMQDVKKYPFKGYHALILACLYRNSLVPELLHTGLNANSVHADVRAHAAINVAVLYGLTGVVEHLLVHKTKYYVDIYRNDFLRETPFTRALRMGHSQIIRLLAPKVSMRFWIESCGVPQEFYNQSCYADDYIERFCPKVDTETREFIKQKTLEQRRIVDR